mmetsp:Transcript_32888/g.83908  ORF Transcript_32888/g.83908 Transcript_32888/m.83908 type:complete len:203 (-) Transcript_32888:248-856(-)
MDPRPLPLEVKVVQVLTTRHGGGSREDDPPGAGGAQVREQPRGEQEGRQHVHRDRLLLLLPRDLLLAREAAVHRGSIVQDAVDDRVALADQLHHLLHVFHAAKICLETVECGVAVQATELVHEVTHPALVTAVHQDGAPLLGKHLHRGPADAGGGSGDEEGALAQRRQAHVVQLLLGLGAEDAFGERRCADFGRRCFDGAPR